MKLRVLGTRCGRRDQASLGELAPEYLNKISFCCSDHDAIIVHLLARVSLPRGT